MALRTLNAIVATNYGKLSADPVLAGDIVTFSLNTLVSSSSSTSQANASGVNPSTVCRAVRPASGGPTTFTRGLILGVCADDALGTNPAGEAPSMINNDPAGSNFVNGSTFLSYTAGFYVGLKRAIGDFKDESIDVVTNLTAGIPTFSQRGVSVYTTPSSQFVTDRVALLVASSATSDGGGAWAPVSGDQITFGAANGSTLSNCPVVPTITTATSSTYNAGLLVKDAGNLSFSIPVGRVDYYDSGAGLMYWTLI